MTPTQLSLKKLRAEGYLCAITERWCPFAKIRQDLWGFCDILCLRGEEILAVQTTSNDNVSKRVNKIADHENTPTVRKAGIRIEVWGWDKDKSGKWKVRIVDCS